MQSGRSSCLTPAHHRLVKSARGQNSPNRQGKILPEEDNGFSRGKSKLVQPPHIVGRLGGLFDEHSPRPLFDNSNVSIAQNRLSLYLVTLGPIESNPPQKNKNSSLTHINNQHITMGNAKTLLKCVIYTFVNHTLCLKLRE